MRHIIDSARAALRDENWYAALVVALTLPDACIACEGVTGHGERYNQFFDRYLSEVYTVERFDEALTKAAIDAAINLNNAPLDFDVRADLGEKARSALQARIDAPKVQSRQMTGPDLFGFRCGVLHDGTFSVTPKEGRTISAFVLVAPSDGSYVHGNLFDDRMQIQVDVLCNQLCDAAERWLAEEAIKPEVAARMSSVLFEIHDLQAPTKL